MIDRFKKIFRDFICKIYDIRGFSEVFPMSGKEKRTLNRKKRKD